MSDEGIWHPPLRSPPWCPLGELIPLSLLAYLHTFAHSPQSALPAQGCGTEF